MSAERGGGGDIGDALALAALGIAGDVTPERRLCTSPTCWGCRAPWMLWPRRAHDAPLRHRKNWEPDPGPQR